MAISVSEVYTTVLYIINKNGSGYLTPDNFNKIARLSQLDLLEKAFEDYNRALLRQKRGGIGAGYADIPEKIKDKIDVFYKTENFAIAVDDGLIVQNIFDSPSEALRPTSLTDAQNASAIQKINFSNYDRNTGGISDNFEKPILIDDGFGTLIDSGAVAEIIITKRSSGNNHRAREINILQSGEGFSLGTVFTIRIGDKVASSDDPTTITITVTESLLNTVFGEIELPVTSSVDGNSLKSDVYKIIDVTSNNRKTSIERIDKHKLSYILSSPLTSPTENFPVYYQQAEQLIIEPAATAKAWSLGEITIDYISVPEDPIYNFSVDDSTYGTPVYTPSAGGVDFTLHPSEEVDLIIRILQYAGISINDLNIVQQAINEKQLQTNQENT